MVKICLYVHVHTNVRMCGTARDCGARSMAVVLREVYEHYIITR